MKKWRQSKIHEVLPDQVSATVNRVNDLSDTVMDSALAGDFRSFLTGDRVTGFAIGVVVGNAFSSFVKDFVDLISGVLEFLGIGLRHGTWAFSVIPWANFGKSFLTMILVAGSVFLFIRILNTFVARNPTEKFGYNGNLMEVKALRKEQQQTNQLLTELISIEKQRQN
ncbi:mechanosensitive ion channel protein MscL [Weissella coleopterorum]|uniref:Mechanosensitive ion channel protein MscL n=1 Tax=Weissella coleopterorum TaxID=2714949 RepID=A0A6G8B0L3_9LACO|nr:MscL family protein [Weissella coleopterorum]QIL50881.1 mechanosensitive ion channel protein MscL [Weissella coleopterorum]